MTSFMGVAGATRGMASPVCMSCSTRARRLPSLPPGWRVAKSSARKPFLMETAMARASPRASMAVVDAVGARPMPQASAGTLQSSATSLARASVDCVSQQKVMSASPIRLMLGGRGECLSDPLDVGEQAEDLLGFAAGGERDDDVAFGEHAEVAVDGLGRVQKERG